jgi:hypothetical protein
MDDKSMFPAVVLPGLEAHSLALIAEEYIYLNSRLIRNKPLYKLLELNILNIPGKIKRTCHISHAFNMHLELIINRGITGQCISM